MRLDDGAMSHLKILRLSDSAFRLWVKALCYCQQHLTDGRIPREALSLLGAKRADVDKLSTPQVEGKAPLWEPIPGFGFQVHDFLQWNDSREEILEKRKRGKKRVTEHRSNGVGNALQEPLHTPAVTPNGASGVSGSYVLRSSEGVQGKPSISEAPDRVLGERAALFLETYAALYAKHRHGARFLRRRRLDWDDAVELCRTWDDERLTKLADIFLTTDDEWIAKTDRGFAVFCARASWCDDRLSAWEATKAVAR